MIFNALSGILDLPPGLSVLDVGTGLSSKPFRERGMLITGIDGSKEMLEHCRSKSIADRLYYADLENPVFPNQTFDLTISHGTLYLINNSTAVVREMIKATRQGGYIAFNYEPSEDSEIRIRLNEASFDPRNPQKVATYAVPGTAMRDIFAQSGFPDPLYAKTGLAALKADGSQIFFETLVYQKPF